MDYLGYEEGVAFGRPRWFVWFRITRPDQFQGLLIRRFYNIPTGGRVARSSNLAIDFMNLTGLRPPANLMPDDFLKGCEVLGRVVTVTDRVVGQKRIQHPAELHYSKVDELLEITDGSSPCIRARALDPGES